MQILPYLGEDALYKEFKLDEAWDGPNNQKLVARMPKVYLPPGVDDYNGNTFYCSFQGPMAFLNSPEELARLRPKSAKPGQPIQGRRITSVTDGTGYTLMLAEAAEPVVWTKPADIPFDPKGPPPKLGGIFRERTNVAMVSGSTAYVTPKSPPDTVKGYITAIGGEGHGLGDPQPELTPEP